MKQQKEQLQYQIPLKKLQLPKGAVECTYREAAEIFYADKEKGSERSAGMMIDKMVDLKLIKKILMVIVLILKFCRLILF